MPGRSRPTAAPLLVVGLIFLAVLSISACRERHSLVVTATAYNSVPSQTDHLPTRAAWGDELRPGMRVVAVSPDLLELGLDRGTRVRIEGLPGSYRVLDKTHGRFRRRIDVYMGNDVGAAREWGAREVRITWFE